MGIFFSRIWVHFIKNMGTFFKNMGTFCLRICPYCYVLEVANPLKLLVEVDPLELTFGVCFQG